MCGFSLLFCCTPPGALNSSWVYGRMRRDGGEGEVGGGEGRGRGEEVGKGGGEGGKGMRGG